jgi:hypothetical protein
MTFHRVLICSFAVAATCCTMLLPAAFPDGLSIGVFDVDATPPVGSQMAYDPAVNTWDMTLRARGIVLLGAGEPVVLCAVDWIGIGNEGHDAFRAGLAAGAGTSPGRVAVHTVHQHDAPGCDFTAEAIAATSRIDPKRYQGQFARDLITRLEIAVRKAVSKACPLTHIGLGAARVNEVASNRRILDENGKVRAMRFTSCPDASLRAEPEGVIDPEVSLVSFWNEDAPVAVLSYYACHPQSYYRTGLPNPDFPGVARFLRQMTVPEALHIHFNGAGGNVGAGKYNDGSKRNRLILAERLAEGMRLAWENSEKYPLKVEDVSWTVVPTALPTAPWLNRESLEAGLKEQADPAAILGSASSLAWLNRCQNGHKIDISCLTLGKARILHLPGELFVEYQLAAKAARPDLFVAMAAYGDYGMGYIGTTAGYEQGGYETSEDASNVAPNTEAVLMDSIRTLLDIEK